MDEADIRKQVTSDDREVLKQSLDFVTEKLELERSRAKSAEDRATAMLAVAGILAGFVVQSTQLLLVPGQGGWLFLLSLYIGAIAFLMKAGLFAIRALWSLKAYELTPELVFEIQMLSDIDAIREELVWKIWEYYQLLSVGNRRLFWTNRSQRNMFIAIISFGFLGTVWFTLETTSIIVPFYVGVIIAVIIAGIVIFLDPVSEKLGNVWYFK
jgi:hypothetical protein